eukprot:488039_1
MNDVQQQQQLLIGKLQQKLTDSQTEIQQLRHELRNNTSKVDINRHSTEFWILVKVNCLNDPDNVKALVQTKKITVNDTTENNETLLNVAASVGSYDIVQFCINIGFDINHKDKWDNTPLDNAKYGDHYHIEQLLLFHTMNISVGNEVKHLAERMHRQNGINQNITNELESIGEPRNTLFETTLMGMMVNLIAKQLSFSDQLLSQCWDIACRDGQDPLSSDLWNVISSTCSIIITSGHKRDWFWFKTCILPSTIWYKEVKTQDNKKGKATETHYLYFELLKLVENESKNQLKILQNDLHDVASANAVQWKQLVEWNVIDQYEKARQDLIPNGITSRYTYNELLEKSGSTFNSAKFYDLNQYLSELVLLAQIVDDEFQQSIQQIFSIDKATHQATLSSDDEAKTDGNAGDGFIQYTRGPVKLQERAKHKAENDYLDEDFPQSACVLDLNRCTFIFNDIATMLRAINLFVNKVQYYQSGSIIGIVRAKNGFTDYVHSTQYADIKLNVLIRGKQKNIIGEVQFLLKRMKQYKDIAHNLYSIERTKDAVESSIAKILPLLLDNEKQLFIAGNKGSVKDICKLMVINNESTKDLLKTDVSEQHILHNICRFGHTKLFLYLKSILSKETFIEYILSPSSTDITPFEKGIRNGAVSIVKNLLQMAEIRNNYNKNKKQNLFRLLFALFGHNINMDFARYVLRVLAIQNETVSDMMSYKYPPPKETSGKMPTGYHRYTILTRIAEFGTYNSLKTFVSIIGEKVFVEHALEDDFYTQHTLDRAVRNQKPEMVRYIMSFEQIKKQYANNKDLVWRLLCDVFHMSDDMIDYILSELHIEKQMIQELVTYRYPTPSQFGSETTLWYGWSERTMIGYVAYNQTLEPLKKLMSIVGEKVFYEGVFLKGDKKTNALQDAIAKRKWNTVKYMLNVPRISTRCMEDADELHSVVSSLNQKFDGSMGSFLINKLKLNQQKLNELKKEKGTDITKLAALVQ